MLVTCRTTGCSNADVSIDLQLDEPVDAIVCGVCGQPITDTAEVAPFPIDEPPVDA